MADEQLDESQVPEETEFETAFAEFADKGEPVEAEPEAPQAKQDEEPDAEEEKAETETKAEGEEEPAAEEDPYAGLSEEAKARFIALEKEKEDLEHRVKSDAGRVSAFQRQVNELKSTVEELQAVSSAGDRPSNKQIAEAMKGSDEDWEQFREDYPAVADAIDRRLERVGEASQEAIDGALKPVTQKLDEVVQTTNENAAEEKSAVVAEVYPNWTEAVKTTEFAEWLDHQPPGVNALALSDDVEDAKTLIGLYDAHLVADGKDSLRAPDPNEPGVKKEEEVAEGDKEPSELDKRRAQQLQDGTAIPSKSAGIDPEGGTAGSEFDQAFEYFARKKMAQRTA